MPPSLSPAARRVARPLARRAVASARVLAPALLVCVLLALLRVRRVEALPEDASSSAPLADVRPAALPSDLIEGYHAGDDDALDAAMLAWLERTRASAASADPAPSPSTTTPPFVEGETGPRESPPRVAPASHLPVARAASVSRSRSNATASPFVRVEGARFALGCEPYAPVGWNTYTLIEQAARVPVGSFDADFSRRGRRQVVDMLDAAVAAGFNTVRTWAYAVGKHQAMQVAPGVYHEPLFEGLDWVLSEADKRSIKVILVLTDYWEYNGGVAQYLDWSGATRNANKNDFFTDRACKRMYEANARVLIERVNVFTGRRYRDDPAIFAWELINEPRCRRCANALQAWIEEMARFVKSLDPNHMLSTGEEGFYGAGALGSVDANPEAWALATGQRFVENHAPPEIDFAVTHLWPDNWGVFSLTGELRRNFSREWIAAHAKDARELLKKPLVLEEFGATGKSGGGGGVGGAGGGAGFDSLFGFSSSLLSRPSSSARGERAEAVAAYYRGVHAQIEADGNRPDGGALRGSMFWTWHHRDLFRVAARTDEYAVFENDPAFREMATHAKELARRAKGRLTATGGMCSTSSTSGEVRRGAHENAEVGEGEDDAQGGGRGWFGLARRGAGACFFGFAGFRC